MSPGKANKIRQVIRQAKENPSALSRLRKAMLSGIPRLHQAIQLPDQNRDTVLTDFVLRYIDHLPNCLDALRGLTDSLGIREYTARFLDAAADFFLWQGNSEQAQRGLLPLMKRAYLAHRILEELNDRVLKHCGIPLAPMDMTRANLLMHQLIGEAQANDLDRLVHETVTRQLDDEELLDDSALQHFVQQQKSTYWHRALLQWPCLTDTLPIAISFGQQQPGYIARLAPAIH